MMVRWIAVWLIVICQTTERRRNRGVEGQGLRCAAYRTVRVQYYSAPSR